MILSNLTIRELQILQLVMAGYTNKEIAAEIYVSQKTVEYHLDNIYEKLGVRTRLLAGLWALEQGLEARPRQIIYLKPGDSLVNSAASESDNVKCSLDQARQPRHLPAKRQGRFKRSGDIRPAVGNNITRDPELPFPKPNEVYSWNK